MKKFYTTFLITILLSTAHGQSFSLDDLVSLTSYTPSKFESYVARKGYKVHGEVASSDSLAYMYYDRKARVQKPEKVILKCDKEDLATIAFQTESIEEYNKLKEQLMEEGYHYSEAAGNALYQKGNITIRPVQKTVDEQTLYCLVVEKKSLPKARDILYAEDFLQITSHEYLVSVFGEANVKKDVFYFSEKEVNKCSVLFPNTNMQVIFIWKDEVNNRDISFLLIGGHLRAQSSLTYHKQIELNSWRSRQGIRSGMSLRELQALNENKINIYGWDTEQPGVVSKKNSGTINFKNIGVILDCFDCNEDRFYTKSDIINSNDLVAQDRRVYVSTIIILPSD